MRRVGGIFIPDSEQYLAPHLQETPGFADNYDSDLLEMALAHTPMRRCVAVDIGASVGLWSRKLVQLFDHVRAFEPLPESRECFALNVQASNCVLYDCALGDRDGTTEIVRSTQTTFKTHVKGGRGSVVLHTLDYFRFPRVDLIKIDCEGFDYYVLLGASKTIADNRPVIVFESKPGVSRARYGIPDGTVEAHMQALDYEMHGTRGNYVCWPKQLRYMV